ncbi:MAG TPA: VOC family protein [Jatrophihabitans sp.]|jgi:predicted enzyme related to lactoylglutathione lyase|nr:VOC family protein [Jatrophihabitans sp.]
MQLVVFPAKDLDAAKRLFTTLLGTDPYADQPYYVGYRAGDVEIGLDPNGTDGPICYWEVDDIDATLKSLEAAGAAIRQPPHEVGGGKQVATVTDGNGNVIGLSTAP